MNESFDEEEILIKHIDKCPEAKEKAKTCMSDQMCKYFSYDANAKNCTSMNKNINIENIKCIKKLEGK